MRVQEESLESVALNVEQESMLGETPESKKDESPKDEGKDNNFKSGDNQYSNK